MSVVKVREIHNGRDADDVTTRTADERRYTRIFRVTTDDPFDDSTIILDNFGIPKTGATHNRDTRAICRRRRARNESFSKLVWIVTCAYSTSFEIEEDPTSDPPRHTWSTQQYQVAFTKDINGENVVNKAGDPFDPPAEIDDSRLSVNIRQNLSAIPTEILSYRNAINETEFVVDGVTVGAQHGLISNIAIGEVQTRNDTNYRAFSYSIQLRDTEDGPWIVELQNVGFNEIVDGDPTKREEIKFKTDGKDSGEPFSSPQQLDNDGVAIVNPSISTMILLKFDAYKLLEFNGLPGIG